MLSHREGWHAHVNTFDNVSLKIRGRYLVKASREQELGDYVCGNALKAEKEIARFAWAQFSQRQGNGVKDYYQLHSAS